MLSAMNWSTVLATLDSRVPNASICLIEASTIALKVPLMRSATKVGKAIALRVSLVTPATLPTARVSNSVWSGSTYFVTVLVVLETSRRTGPAAAVA